MEVSNEILPMKEEEGENTSSVPCELGWKQWNSSVNIFTPYIIFSNYEMFRIPTLLPGSHMNKYLE